MEILTTGLGILITGILTIRLPGNSLNINFNSGEKSSYIIEYETPVCACHTGRNCCTPPLHKFLNLLFIYLWYQDPASINLNQSIPKSQQTFVVPLVPLASEDGVFVFVLFLDGSGIFPGGGHDDPFLYSCPQNPTEEPGRLPSIGLQRVGHNCSDLAHTWMCCSLILLFELPSSSLQSVVYSGSLKSFQGGSLRLKLFL